MSYIRWFMPIPEPPAPLPVPSATPVTEYVAPPITVPGWGTTTTTPEPQDKLVQTIDENGNPVTTQQIAKPTPPPPPTVTNPDDLTNPDTKPQYPTYDPNNPKLGDINEKGETYLPGIGWLGDDDRGGRCEFVPGMDGGGAQIGH